MPEDSFSHIASVDEFSIAPVRPNGTTRSPRPIWGVRLGANRYVRGTYGEKSAWHRIARASGQARISADGQEAPVSVTDADSSLNDAVDAA